MVVATRVLFLVAMFFVDCVRRMALVHLTRSLLSGVSEQRRLQLLAR
jgi:hypothetical protein